MSSMTTKTTYQGYTVSVYDKAFMATFNKLMRSKSFGGETSDITMLQGGFNRGGVAASAGTHDGGGAMDVTPYNIPNRLKGGRILGNCLNDRPTIRGLWVHHMHGVMDGESSLSAGAKSQVADHHRDIDGLADRKPETGYQMIVFPQFVEGHTGTYYAKVNCHMYEQQTTKSKNLGPLKKGDKFTAIAATKVGSAIWLINVDGKCALEANLSKTKPADSGVETPKPPTTSTPPTGGSTPPKALSYDLPVITQNECGNRLNPYNPGKNGKPPVRKVGDFQVGVEFATRVHLMTDLYKDTGAMVVCTQEAGGKSMSAQFNEALAKSLGGVWNDWNCGDLWDISQTVTWNTKTHKAIEKFEINFTPMAPGSSHHTASCVVLEHIETGIRHLQVSLHLISGHTAQNAIDRGKQVTNMMPKIRQAQKDYGGIPLVITGDVNASLNDANDAVGKAFAKAGFIDVENTPCAVVNPEWNSSNQKDINGVKHGSQIDRCFIEVDGKITAVKRVILVPLVKGKISVPHGWPSDHWAVLFVLTIHS